MKLSTRVRYGTRLMLDLSMHYGDGPVLLREVSKRQEISVKYLEQLVPPLRVAGLVKSTRGPHGGYHLTKRPTEITLYEIVSTLDGSTELAECVKVPDSCHRSEACVTREIWTDLNQKVVDMLQGITLEKMAERQRKLKGDHATMYHI